jgi:hypothetical protein
MAVRKKTTTARKPAARKPAAKKPTAKKPAAKKPAAKKPAAKKSTTSAALQKRIDTAKEEALAEAEIEKQEALAAQKEELLKEQEEAAQKAVEEATKTIAVEVRHGLSRRHTVQAPPTATVVELLSDPDLRAVLSFGENVKAVMNGQELSSTETIGSLGESPKISLETKENRKA